MRLGGGNVLLSSRQALLDVLRALQSVREATRRDGWPFPSRVQELVELLAAELEEISPAGKAEVPPLAVVPVSRLMTDPMTSAEAGAALGVTPRQARNLPALQGRLVNGRWVCERTKVEDELRRRTLKPRSSA